MVSMLLGSIDGIGAPWQYRWYWCSFLLLRLEFVVVVVVDVDALNCGFLAVLRASMFLGSIDGFGASWQY